MKKDKNKNIRISKHIIPHHTNTNKLVSLDLFIEQYKSIVTQLVDYIWNNEIIWGDKKSIFNRQLDLLNCPSMLCTNSSSQSVSMSKSK